jgi:hypothetical protein
MLEELKNNKAVIRNRHIQKWFWFSTVAEYEKYRHLPFFCGAEV